MATTHHDDERYEELGLVPTIAMVLVGFLIAISPALVKLALLIFG